jgi:hypothetical protein
MLTNAFLFLLLMFPSLHASPSLFFTKAEIEALTHTIAEQKTIDPLEVLSLTAILYIHETQWTIWVNQRIIRSDHPCPLKNFRIEEVTPHTVTFSWHPPHTPHPRIFTLRPGQVMTHGP